MATPASPRGEPAGDAFALHVPQRNPSLQVKAAMQRYRQDAPGGAAPDDLAHAQRVLRDAFPLPKTPLPHGAPWWAREDAVPLHDGDDAPAWTPRVGPVPLCMDRDKVSAVGRRVAGMVATPEQKAAVDAAGVRAVTHYVYAGMRGGAWVVPPGSEEGLRRAIVTDFHNGVYTGITENKTRLWAAYVDLDFSAPLTYAAVALVARVCHAVVCRVYASAVADAPRKARAVVCIGTARHKTGVPRKTGVHIVWPDVVVDVQRQLVLAQQMREMLQYVLHAPPKAPRAASTAAAARDAAAAAQPAADCDTPAARAAAWADVVDGAVYQPGRGLRMPYCPKFVKCPRRSACPHDDKNATRGSGGYVRCHACYHGHAPDTHSTVYMPMFVLLGVQRFTGAGARLVPTAHTLTTARTEASATLLALCVVRRQGAVAPTAGFDAGMEAFTTVPDALWKEARCTPAGHWLGPPPKRSTALKWRGYYPAPGARAMWQLQWSGENVPPHSNEAALLTALVQASSARYAHVRVHSAQRFRDNDLGLVKWYAVYVVANQAREDAGGAHACANRPVPHKSSTVYFIVHTHITPPGRSACMPPSVLQACMCKKTRLDTVSGARCADFQKRLMHVPDTVDRVLFPVVPVRDAAHGAGAAPPAAAHGVLTELNEDFLDATASETRALSGVTRARQEELRRMEELVRAAPHDAAAARSASVVAHRAAVKRPASCSFAAHLQQSGEELVAKFKAARRGAARVSGASANGSSGGV